MLIVFKDRKHDDFNITRDTSYNIKTFQTIDTGHLYIHQRYVRLPEFDLLFYIRGVWECSDYIKCRISRQQTDQTFPENLVVFIYDNFYFHCLQIYLVYILMSIPKSGEAYSDLICGAAAR